MSFIGNRLWAIAIVHERVYVDETPSLKRIQHQRLMRIDGVCHQTTRRGGLQIDSATNRRSVLAPFCKCTCRAIPALCFSIQRACEDAKTRAEHHCQHPPGLHHKARSVARIPAKILSGRVKPNNIWPAFFGRWWTHCEGISTGDLYVNSAARTVNYQPFWSSSLMKLRLRR